MKRVVQRHKTGCGVACIAMIYGLNYEKALKLVHPNRKSGQKAYTSAFRISEILKSQNSKYKVYLTSGFSAKTIKNPCILGIRQVKDKAKGFPKRFHWVIYEKGKILDPWAGSAYNINYCEKRTFIIYEIETP